MDRMPTPTRWPAIGPSRRRRRRRQTIAASLSEADRHLVALIALRSLDTYHESLEGLHGPPGGDPRTWQAMDAARQRPVRADLEQAWYHVVRYDRSGALTDRQVFCPSCYAQTRLDADARGDALPCILPGRTTSNPTARGRGTAD